MSDLSSDFHRIHQLDTELEISSSSLDRNPYHIDDQTSIPSSGDAESINPMCEDIASFCQQFNKKVGVSTSNLDDVLEIVELLLSNHSNHEFHGDNVIEKLRSRLKASKERNCVIRQALFEAESKSDSLQSEVDQLKFENHCLKESLEQSNSTIKRIEQETIDLREKVGREGRSRKLLEENLGNLGDLVQSQLADTSVIAQQRDRLIVLVNQQNLIMQSYEDRLTSLDQHADPTIDRPIVPEIPVFESDLPIALTTLIRTICEVLPDYQTRLSIVRDDTTMPILKRIEKVAHLLSQAIAATHSELDATKQHTQTVSQQLDESRARSFRILALFDEELGFLQKLAHSNDLQDCLFFRPDRSLHLDQECQSELVRHCIRVSRYVEDLIERANQPEFANSEVFNVMAAGLIEQKLQSFIARMDDDNLETRELFALFRAQVFVNDILQNHALELRTRCELAQREMHQMQANGGDASATAQRTIRRFQRRDAKIRRCLARAVAMRESDDLLPAISRLVSQLPARAPAGQLSAQLHGVEQALTRAEDALSAKVQAYEDALAQRTAEAHELARELASARAELTAAAARFGEAEAARVRELTDCRASSERSLADLQARLAEADAALAGARDELRTADARVQRLRKAKRDARERLALLEATQLSAVQALKQKAELIRADFARVLCESRAQLDDLRAHLAGAESRSHALAQENEQLSADVRDGAVRERSLELRLRALDERRERDAQAMAVRARARLEQAQREGDAREQRARDLIRAFVEGANRDFRCSFADAPLDAFLDALRRFLAENYEREVVYEETVGDIVRVRRLLAIAPSDEIAAHVQRLIDECARAREDARERESAARAERERSAQAAAALARCEEDGAALRRWEAWAKRLHRIVHETVCVTFSGEQLRMALEETLLAAVSHRSLINRLNSLRYQKRVLLDVGREVLGNRGELKASLFALIAMCSAGLRMQRIAGCIKIDAGEALPMRRSPKMGRAHGKGTERPQ